MEAGASLEKKQRVTVLGQTTNEESSGEVNGSQRRMLQTEWETATRTGGETYTDWLTKTVEGEGQADQEHGSGVGTGRKVLR